MFPRHLADKYCAEIVRKITVRIPGTNWFGGVLRPAGKVIKTAITQEAIEGERALRLDSQNMALSEKLIRIKQEEESNVRLDSLRKENLLLRENSLLEKSKTESRSNDAKSSIEQLREKLKITEKNVALLQQQMEELKRHAEQD